jgi:hypothetical protein
MKSPDIVHYKNLKTGVIWDMAPGSEEQKRCARLRLEYEEIKDERKKD